MRVVNVLGPFLGLAVTGLVLLWLGQRRLIYYPAAPPVPPVTTLQPDALDVTFETDDGLRLGGWFFPARTERSSGAVLVCNGNAGSRADRLPLASALARRGLDVLLFDYRGYGGNPGTPTEAGLRLDALAARAFLVSRPGVRAERIVYFGESLGSGVAVALASDHPPAALVLRSPFTSLVDAARVHYPWLPVGLILRDRFRSDRNIGVGRSPLFVIAGDADSIVPHAQSRRLFEMAAADAKRFLSIPRAEHNDARLVQGQEMIDDLMNFLSEHAGLEIIENGGERR